MADDERVERSRDDLVGAFGRQYRRLVSLCGEYDDGGDEVAPEIATKLRVLLHDGKGRSKSLLTSLGVKHDVRYLDSAGVVAHPSAVFDLGLLSMTVRSSPTTPSIIRYEPSLDDHVRDDDPRQRVAWTSWWGQQVVRVPSLRTIRRSDIVRSMADTDGGAHEDAFLESWYQKLTRQNGLGVKTISNHFGERDPENSPGDVLVRQIAHEVIRSLRESIPGLSPDLSAEIGRVAYEPKRRSDSVFQPKAGEPIQTYTADPA